MKDFPIKDAYQKFILHGLVNDMPKDDMLGQVILAELFFNKNNIIDIDYGEDDEVTNIIYAFNVTEQLGRFAMDAVDYIRGASEIHDKIKDVYKPE